MKRGSGLGAAAADRARMELWTEMANFDSNYEVMVLEGERWHVKHVTADQGDAMATATELSKRIGVLGVRVLRDFHDTKSGLSYEKVIFEQLKDTKKKASYARIS